MQRGAELCSGFSFRLLGGALGFNGFRSGVDISGLALGHLFIREALVTAMQKLRKYRETKVVRSQSTH